MRLWRAFRCADSKHPFPLDMTEVNKWPWAPSIGALVQPSRREGCRVVGKAAELQLLYDLVLSHRPAILPGSCQRQTHRLPVIPPTHQSIGQGCGGVFQHALNELWCEAHTPHYQCQYPDYLHHWIVEFHHLSAEFAIVLGKCRSNPQNLGRRAPLVS